MDSRISEGSKDYDILFAMCAAVLGCHRILAVGVIGNDILSGFVMGIFRDIVKG